MGSASVDPAGRCGVLDEVLVHLTAGWRAARPARTGRCGHGDRLTVHAVLDGVQPADVDVPTMPASAGPRESITES